MTHVISDSDLKKQLIASTNNVEPVSKSTSSFPTEIIDLPSKGKLYPESHPLSKGCVEMKYMTAKEEDILTSQSLISKGVVIDKVIQSLIVTKFDYTDLLIPDKNALMFAARVLAYGKDYEVEISCPKCKHKSKHNTDLSALNDIDIDWDKVTTGVNSFEFTLPASKNVITFKILNNNDERLIEDELKSRKKMSNITGIDPELTTRLKHIIIAINGNSDKNEIQVAVEKMLSRDSLALRRYIRSVTPGIDSKFDFTCPECDHTENVNIPMEVSFFWPGV